MERCFCVAVTRNGNPTMAGKLLASCWQAWAPHAPSLHTFPAGAAGDWQGKASKCLCPWLSLTRLSLPLCKHMLCSLGPNE